MILNEPPRSQYDLNFSLLGIPVRVHPLFWLVAVLLGIRGNEDPVPILIWVGVVFVSILVHELGHALTARWYGWEPWITLHSFGGLASYRPTFHDPTSRIVITLAGPGAGFQAPLDARKRPPICAGAGRAPRFGGLGRRLEPFARRRIVPVIYGFFIANLALFWIVFEAGVHGAIVAGTFFVWVSVFNLFVVSLFWSLMSDLWRNDQAKRLYGFIAAGGSVE